MTRICKFKSWINAKQSRRFVLVLVLAGILAPFLVPLPKGARVISYSRVILSKDGKLLRAYLSEDQKWRFATETRSLPPLITQSLMCLEDKRFLWHWGVDPIALARALGQNLQSGRVLSGGSTLTMQVARLLEPKKRTLSSKIIEALRALQLEAQLSKSEILDLYLTYAPFGANIEGLEAASYRYFKKPSKFLAPGELAFLLLLPQSPHRWDRKSVSSLETKRAQVLDRLLACDVISAEDRDQALTSPIPEWRSSFESHAEHLSDLVPAKQPSNTSFNIQTTLDYQIQSSIEDLIHHSEASLRAKGILNVSVLVLDNPSGELRAAIGNFDFYRSSDNQKMTGFNTFRSTGSLLKPFIFARLIEAGQMLPATLLEDVPIDVEGYEPKNYDGQFSGLVEAQLALSNSLNVPWVKQLRDHGIDGFLTFLLNSGMRSSLTRDKLGLSIAIGGLETTQWDLLMLYRALARDGKIKPIRWLRNEPSRDEWQWLHPGAVELTRDALAIRGRPDFAIDPSYLKQSDIRWKTGTSQGNRDAWAIGFTARYTIAVWLGNLDYAPAPALVGPEVSAPILFDAFSRIRNIDKEPLHQWNHRHTEQVEVCAFSGLPAGPHCPHRKLTMAVKGLPVHKRCPYHDEILVDEKTNLRINKDCEQPTMKPKLRSFLSLPADVRFWASNNLPSIEMAPRFSSQCRTKTAEKGKVFILTPEPKTYWLHAGVKTLDPKTKKELMTLPLKLKISGLSSGWHCYLNGKPLGIDTFAITPSFTVPVGDHDLLCTDEQGHTDQVAFAIER